MYAYVCAYAYTCTYPYTYIYMYDSYDQSRPWGNGPLHYGRCRPGILEFKNGSGSCESVCGRVSASAPPTVRRMETQRLLRDAHANASWDMLVMAPDAGRVANARSWPTMG